MPEANGRIFGRDSGLQMAMEKLEQHRPELKAVAQTLHTDEKTAPAVVAASDEAPARQQLPS
jgi:hypothetical protein